jgi:hypothetical protein
MITEEQTKTTDKTTRGNLCRGLLLSAGLWSLAAYCAFWALMQSQTLWARPIALPGGDSGIFGEIWRLFPGDWLQASGTTWLGFANSLFYVSLLLLLFWVYRRALSLVYQRGPIGDGDGDEKRLLRTVLVVTALVLLVLLFVPGTMSADLHSYIWYGRILYDYGANPFLHAPVEFASRDAGRWLDLVYWKDVPSVYGPVWVWLSGGIAWMASLLGGDISVALLGHKLLAAVAHLVNVFLVWSVAGLVVSHYWGKSPRPDIRKEDWQLTNRLGATVFYAWNPLLLIEFGANGHNDILLLTFMLGGLWQYLAGRWRTAALAFSLACMVKASALLLWPGFLWLLFWHRAVPPSVQEADVGEQGVLQGVLQGALQGRIRADIGLTTKQPGALGMGRVAQAAGIAVTTWMICYLPFWEGIQTLRPLVDGPASRLFVNSLASMVRFKGGEWLHEVALVQGWPSLAGRTADHTRAVVEGWIRWLAWGITFGLAARYTWRGRTLRGMLEGWGWLLFFYLAIGAVWLWPWYVAWLIVPVALVGPGRLMTATLILCTTSLSLYAAYPQIPTSISEIFYWRPLLTIAPALVYLGIVSIVQRKRSLRISYRPAPASVDCVHPL